MKCVMEKYLSNHLKSHTIQYPQGVINENTVVVFHVDEASTAQEHLGFSLVTGYLFKYS